MEGLAAISPTDWIVVQFREPKAHRVADRTWEFTACQPMLGRDTVRRFRLSCYCDSLEVRVIGRMQPHSGKLRRIIEDRVDF